MQYAVRINKRVKNVRVFTVLKKTSGNVNIVTKLFIRIFAGKKKDKDEQLKV